MTSKIYTFYDKLSIPRNASDDDIIDAYNKLFEKYFQLERNNGNTIIITMNQNTTNSERILYINLQGGDYFDGIKIIQSNSFNF